MSSAPAEQRETQRAPYPPLSPIAHGDDSSSEIMAPYGSPLGAPFETTVGGDTFDTFDADLSSYTHPMVDMDTLQKKRAAYALLDRTWQENGNSSDYGASWDDDDLKDVLGSMALAVIEGKAALDAARLIAGDGEAALPLLQEQLRAAYKHFADIWAQLRRLRGIPLIPLAMSMAGDGSGGGGAGAAPPESLYLY